MSILRTIGLVVLGWKLHSIFTPEAVDTAPVPPWWDDVMLRSFASDQVIPPPPGMSASTADAAGAAAAAHRIPIAWVYLLLMAGLPVGQVQVAAAALHNTALQAGAPPNSQEATLSAWRKAVVGSVAAQLQVPALTAAAPAKEA